MARDKDSAAARGHYDDSHWHLDKRIPVALIMTIILQTVAAIWWAANLSARVDLLEAKVAGISRNADGLQKAALRATRLEVQQNAIQATLAEVKAAQRRIEAKLDQLLSKQP